MQSTFSKAISRLTSFWRKKGRQTDAKQNKEDDGSSHNEPVTPQEEEREPPSSSLQEDHKSSRKSSSSSYHPHDLKSMPQLIANIVDQHATNNPEKIFASIPFDNDDLSQGFRDITYLDLRKAVDKAAYWIEQTLGVPPKNTHSPDQQADGSSDSKFPTFAFYGGRDLRYSIFVIAAMKTGYKMLSPSLLCAMDAHVYLVKETDCHNLLCVPSTVPLVEEIIAQFQEPQAEKDSPSPYTISNTIVPELLDILPIEKTQEEEDRYYPYNKRWDEACHDPCLIIHTSGSTGMPKIIYYTQRMLANPLFQSLQPPINDQPPLVNEWHGRIFTTVPPFHLLGYAGFLVCPIYFNCVGVMAPPGRLIDANLADEMHRYARLDGGMYHPSLLQDLVRDEHKRQELGKLKVIFYSGSPLETTTGQWLASNFGTVRNLLGSTESFGWPVARVIDPVNDWNYIHFYPTNGLHFEPVGLEGAKDAKKSGKENDENDELYELIVRRTPETETLTNIFLSRPHLTEWPTRDLWKPHSDPAKKGHWLYRGRTDDLVVLSGEIKMYAASLEDKISSAHPLIRTALIGGNQRKWPFLLLELVDSATASPSSATLDDIWSRLEEINNRYTHGSVRLHRSLVLVVDKSRPFVRLAKGSVARNPTYALYKQDIDDLYAAMEK
ncbi:hypothetical protein UA08_03244 [Talaromyces atroroseus]|uniref:AMP-dependent synthetase/ligase domain-containing protein n=1 Tax=Talaromyces atroroseus TaxID=1441469 RepID=A0A225B4U2_TALAT|nr:hypothetical protein UA08_03244 [Talaromyces atroroseus]OKL60947.1 hypothetical protein UA08_03244 [Talaromyces atroroseus]